MIIQRVGAVLFLVTLCRIGLAMRVSNSSKNAYRVKLTPPGRLADVEDEPFGVVCRKHGECEELTHDTKFPVCTDDDEYLELEESLARRLIKPFNTNRFGSNFCLELLEVGEVITRLSARSVTDVRQSALQTVGSLLYFTMGGNGDPVFEALRFEPHFRTMDFLYYGVKSKMNATEEEALIYELEKDLERTRVFKELEVQGRMPQRISAKDAINMLREILRRTFAQKIKQCWIKGAVCAIEQYGQSHCSVAATLLALTLEARAEQEKLDVDKAGQVIAPVVAAYHLFDKYLSTDIAFSHLPEAHEWLQAEATALLKDVRSVLPNKFDRKTFFPLWYATVYKFYVGMCFTSTPASEGLISSRIFWYHLFDLWHVKDASIGFHRATLLAALRDGLHIAFPKDNIIASDDFKHALTTAEVALGFLQGLESEMKVESGMAQPTLAIGARCSLAMHKMQNPVYKLEPSSKVSRAFPVGTSLSWADVFRRCLNR